MTQNPNLAALSEAGVSVWLDDLSRDRLQTGNLQELIDTKGVVGVTTDSASANGNVTRQSSAFEGQSTTTQVVW